MQENQGVGQLSPKTAFFRMDIPGVYRLRILPLAPNRDGSLDCKRYEHPFRPLNVETLKRQGGDRFCYAHALYALDLNNRKKGIQLLILNHSQFMDLEDKRSKLWQQALAKNPYAVCPLSSVYNAFPIEIEKRKSGGRTEYLISIDDKGENDALSLKELDALMAAPRIPEAINRYLRQQAEAAVESFKQGGCEDDLPF